MSIFEDFSKLDIRIGEIISAEKIPDTDKLLRLEVDLGEEEYRQIISGIAEYFEDIEALVGRQCPFIVNLEPRVIRGHESCGMILAVSTEDQDFALLHPGKYVHPGSVVH